MVIALTLFHLISGPVRTLSVVLSSHGLFLLKLGGTQDCTFLFSLFFLMFKWIPLIFLFKFYIQVWCCGGQILHVFCSHFGHVARSQPYSFPDDRLHTEVHNYKRAADLWFGPYKKYVYNYFPLMRVLILSIFHILYFTCFNH